MIHKHPANRAERLLINEKKKRIKRASIEEIPPESLRTFSTNVETERENN